LLSFFSSSFLFLSLQSSGFLLFFALVLLFHCPFSPCVRADR
jgi:hypothetical protein